VGEVMAMGRTFQQSLQKALRSLEINCDGLDPFLDLTKAETADILRRELRLPGAQRIRYIADAFRFGFPLEKIAKYSGVDPWFLAQIEELLQWESKIAAAGFSILDHDILLQLKKKGFSDRRLATLLKVTESDVRELRDSFNIHPVYKRVDSCAGEFSSNTAYMYSCYEPFCEAKPSTNKNKIIVLGGGPNRIGQGIEFDYCCVHAALAISEQGYETIMVNCNPETVSTDYDISDRLYFEPLTLEDVLEIVRVEQPQGVIVQYGGQTPLKLARALEKANVPIIGTSPDAIDRAEDRERFQALIQRLQLHQPPNGIARNIAEGLQVAKTLEYPLIVRPSYVLGGRAMEIVYNDEELQDYLQAAVQVSDNSPVLLDRFLDDAVEVDVDAVCDGKNVLIAGIMEHIEQAGVHSGDSACSLPPFSLSDDIQIELDKQMRVLALELGVVGLMNAQFAIQKGKIYILEVNPRASRTVPFVSKVTGIPLAKVAAKCMVGLDLIQQGLTKGVQIDYFGVKMPVFPFSKFLGVDPILGPEMKSTGEVMGVGENFGEAYAKAQLGAGKTLPKSGRAFVSVRDPDKAQVIDIAKNLQQQGFEIWATHGTEKVLKEANVSCRRINKVREGRPHIVDMIKNNEIRFIVNTTEGKQAIADSYTIRRNALQHKVCYTTTVSGAKAALLAMRYGHSESVKKLQQLHKTCTKMTDGEFNG